MKYNPDMHHRHSIRLRNYDYSQSGAYFITMCTQNKMCLFGDISENEIKLNSSGQMLLNWWYELSHKYQGIETDVAIVMPNHFHGIVFVGAALCSCPESGRSCRIAPTLGNIINWFKTMTTNEYIRCVKEHGWLPFHKKLWQRNYYEHIIRNEKELNNTRQYIVNNPSQWELDHENPALAATEIAHNLRRGSPMWLP